MLTRTQQPENKLDSHRWTYLMDKNDCSLTMDLPSLLSDDK